MSCQPATQWQRLAPVHDPVSGKTYLIDLNRMPTCDGLEPLPLADGSNPYLDRLRKSFGSKLQRPDWLTPPAGATLDREEAAGEMVMSPTEAMNSWTGFYKYSGQPAEAIEHYRSILTKAGFRFDGKSWGHGELAASAKGSLGEVRVTALTETSGVVIFVSYTVRKQGHFRYQPGTAFPTLDMDRFDAAAGALLLVDRETGQRFRLRREVVEAEDESQNAHATFEPARFPAWLTRYPGAQVAFSMGAMVIKGVRHPEPGQETLLTIDPFEKVVQHYRNLAAAQKLTVVAASSGDERRDGRRRFDTVELRSADSTVDLFVGVTEVTGHTEIQLHSFK